MLFVPAEETEPNWWIFGGSLVFVVFTLAMGLSQVPLAQEIIFSGSMVIVLFLMQRLLLELDPPARKALIGTADLAAVMSSGAIGFGCGKARNLNVAFPFFERGAPILYAGYRCNV